MGLHNVFPFVVVRSLPNMRKALATALSSGGAPLIPRRIGGEPAKLATRPRSNKFTTDVCGNHSTCPIVGVSVEVKRRRQAGVIPDYLRIIGRIQTLLRAMQAVAEVV